MALRLLLFLLSLFLPAFALWPIPAALDTGTTALILSPSFSFDVAIDGAPVDLYEAVNQALYYLQNDKLGRLVVGRGANDTAALAHAPSLTSLKLSLVSGAPVTTISSESVKPLGSRSEDYVLSIPSDARPATLTANSTLGLYRGLTTFGQLWYYYAGTTYTLEAPIEISDAPAYVGVLAVVVSVAHVVPSSTALSWVCARHVPELVRVRVSVCLKLPCRRRVVSSFPIGDLLRTLDAMSWVKINTFHWHITDSQSFPLEVAQYPQLAMNGAYSSDETYSESDVQYIVAYAAAVRPVCSSFDTLLISRV